jgi:amino acid transporter
MADFKTRAAIKAGKDAVRRVYDDLTLSEEEKARREEERAAARRKLKWKIIVGAVLAVVVVIALMALLAKVWLWVIGFAVLAVLAAAAYFYVRPKLSGVRVREVEAAPAEPVSLPAPPRENPEEVARAARERTAAQERKIDEELAALKAKAGKPR